MEYSTEPKLAEGRPVALGRTSESHDTRKTRDLKVTTVSHFDPKRSESHDTRETGDLKATTVSHFDPKTSESHDTRETSDLKTAADHQLLNKNA